MSFELSPDQKKVLDSLLDWFNTKDRSEFITLGGYAGTGKSTVIGIFRQMLNAKNKKINVAFCSYTGKATRVLISKLNETNANFEKDSVSTIHSLIYSPVTNNKQEIIGWERKPKLDKELIIVDEASMIDEEIWRDLLAYKVPIIAVGDHGQLPPIRGKLNLMENPQLRLEKIHRQAEDNPIINLSIIARENGTIEKGHYDGNVFKIMRQDEESREIISELLTNFNKDTLVLCGFNTTRVKLNRYIRSGLDFNTDEPVANDRVICLRNNHAKQIYNGMLGTIKSIEPDDEKWYYSTIATDDGETYRGLIYAPQFNNPVGLNFSEERALTIKGDIFDFGYALTVHKAQGSQAKRVILFEERSQHMDDDTWRRWLYTGITRAEQELYIIGK